MWRAHGHNGTLVKEGGGNAIKRQLRPPIYTRFVPKFSTCGTMSHTFLTCCRRRGRNASVGCDQMAEIAWTRVHEITNEARAGMIA